MRKTQRRSKTHWRARSLVALATSIVALGCQIADPPEDATVPSTRTQTLDGGSEAGTKGNVAATEAACDSAYSVVCGASGEVDAARMARLEEIERSIDEEATATLAWRVAEDPARYRTWLAELGPGSKPDRWHGARLLRKVRAESLASRVEPVRDVVIAEHERMRRVAIERVGASRGADRDGALARLARARLRWIDARATTITELPRWIVLGCGESLLVDDAWIDKSSTAITLCPGFLLVSEADDPAAFRARIAFILAHELGHVIAGPAHGREEEREAELIADRWASELLAAELESIDDPAAREVYLRRALEPICYREGDRVHDSGSERITSLVVRHPAIDASIPCADSV